MFHNSVMAVIRETLIITDLENVKHISAHETFKIDTRLTGR